jgi:glycosyltransferase involved in cell wall biosynthesis
MSSGIAGEVAAHRRRIAPRRIALFSETGGPGGAERMMLQLGEELGRRGHEVIPVAPADRNQWLLDQFRARGFQPEMFVAGNGADFQCLREMMRILERRRVDVVHTHEFLTSVYIGAAARLTGRPHIITMHGGRYYAGRRRRRLALRWSAKRSRALVGVSTTTAVELAQHLWLPRERVRVVHNGVRSETGDRTPVRRELGIADDERLVVAIGNLYPVKAHSVLLRALVRLNDDPATSRWRLAIAGRGEEEASLRRLAIDAGIADRVHLLGYRADVANVLAAGDVYAMPSLSEGLPLALIEAMFAGKPVVASDVGGIPEVVTNGTDGLLVPAGDPAALAAALKRLFLDTALAERLRTAARRRAEGAFGVERMVDEYEKLYGF